MSFRPIIPTSGYSGWLFLQRTLDKQVAAFERSPQVQRETDYFRESIAKVRSAEDLVSDRRLLQVGLTAFGLEDDINSRAFLRRILEDGTLKEGALALKLSDKRYEAFAREFGFGDLGARTGLPRFAERIIERFEARSFERAVGEQDPNFRLALNLTNGLSDVLERSASPRAQWFSVMGNPPLRRVFEGALGLPPGIGSIDVDRQLTIFQERARATFGTDNLTDFNDEALRERLIRLFLVRAEIDLGLQMTSGSVALQLLRSMG
ncbi:MAG: DUF1217 domain-containing protein [Rubellimicrobium sp.]|nr:DUF1217 domain-containing protein [Rubellimicrobium sp.]